MTSLLALPAPVLGRVALVTFDEPQIVGSKGKSLRGRKKTRCGFLLRLVCAAGGDGPLAGRC